MCLAGLVLAVWGFSIYGIPLMAKQASKAIPASVMRPLGEQTMEVLDSRFLSPSKMEYSVNILGKLLPVTGQLLFTAPETFATAARQG